MGKTRHIDRLIESGTFRFDTLTVSGVDNGVVCDFHSPAIAEQETNLFHHDVASGDDYCDLLHDFVAVGMTNRRPAPVVRFADGEYAFYDGDLQCNGLYRQAESTAAIREAMAVHVDALTTLAATGKLAPLIFPGNTDRKRRGVAAFFRKADGSETAARFVDLLHESGIELTKENYIPFYIVYAYLTSWSFATLVDGRNISIIGSDCDGDACRAWFARYGSEPHIASVEIPQSYMATRWPSVRDAVLDAIPGDTDLCLVGAGIGSLLVCVDAALRCRIPAIDAGHVLNMMNGREDKSQGPRLYTVHSDTHEHDEGSS